MNGPMFNSMSFFMGSAAGAIPAFVALIPFLVIYILGRARENRSGDSDGTLGPRVFLTLMMSVAFHIVLIGVAILCSELFRDDGRVTIPGDRYSTALGMIIGGGLAGAYPTAAYVIRYIKPSPTGVFRAALGINAIYTGLVFSFAITATMVGLMKDDSTIHVPLGTAFTYFSANLICAFPLLAGRRKPRSLTEDESRVSAQE